MRNAVQYNGWELTRHTGQLPLYFGRTLKDWFWVYAFFAGMLFCVCLVYVRYLELFDNISHQEPDQQIFAMWFSGIPLLLLLPALAGLLWWAGGYLTRYSRWQERQPLLWRIFWIVVLVFYSYVEMDPMDSIHPQMSHKGIGPAPDIIAMFETGYSLEAGIPLVQFQWGYFLLWTLFWFLIIVLHWQYFADGLREVWFYILRFHRYGASVLTGFRETARTQLRQPVDAGYPDRQPELPPTFRGVPQLNVEQLTAEQAAAVIAADASGAIVSAPGQPAVLFVDLGRFDYAPALADLKDDKGRALLRFADRWGKPGRDRAELVIPLKAGTVGPAADETAGGGA